MTLTTEIFEIAICGLKTKTENQPWLSEFSHFRAESGFRAVEKETERKNFCFIRFCSSAGWKWFSTAKKKKRIYEIGFRGEVKLSDFYRFDNFSTETKIDF